MNEGQALPERKERGDLDDPAKIKRKEIEARLDRRQELEDVAWILNDARGRRFYWRIMKRCKLFESSFTGNNTTFFNEGERNIGLILMAELNESAPQAYLQMLQEAKKNELK